MRSSSIVFGVGLLVGGLVLAHAADASEIDSLASLEIDLDDPEEASLWKELPPANPSESSQLDFDFVPRRADLPGSPDVLRISTTLGLGVESRAILWRPFPDDFRPSRGAVRWTVDWRVRDTSQSDWVALGFVFAQGDDLLLSRPHAITHTRYTVSAMRILTPEDRWIRQEFTRWNFGRPTIDAGRPIGIYVETKDPLRQEVRIATIRIDLLPAGSLPTPDYRERRWPGRGPVYQPKPITQLDRATSGVLDDFDGDTAPDLLVAEHEGHLRLYLNDGLGGFFEEVSDIVEERTPLIGNGALLADLDGDGDQDLIVPAEMDVLCFYERTGPLRFREIPALEPTDHQRFWYAVAASDVDRDGRLDLAAASATGGPQDVVILRNQEPWQFEPWRLDTDERRWKRESHFTVTWADIDADGVDELIAGHAAVFAYAGGGFAAIRPWPLESRKSEGTVTGDFDGDGNLDVLILQDRSESGERGAPSRIWLGSRDGHFVDGSEKLGLPYLDSAEVALAEDFDNDGRLDLYICQRHRDNLLLAMQDGRYRDRTAGSGLGDSGDCDSAIAGDVDRDGRIDVVILRYGAPPAVLRNELVAGHWLGVRLEGRSGEADFVGARVEVLLSATGAGATSVRWSRRGRGFGSNGPDELRFGLGDRESAEVLVHFPDGTTRRRRVDADHTVVLRQPGDGLLAGVHGWYRERLAPEVRYLGGRLRRGVGPRVALAGLGVILALLAGAGPSARGTVLGVGIVASAALLWLGTAPSKPWLAAPAAFWGGGWLAGAALLLGQRRYVRARAFVVEPAETLEELIRFTLDFRHAGLQMRDLLSIETRVQNLFMREGVHTDFLAELRQRASRYARTTSPRLRELFERVRRRFPGLSTLDEAVALERDLERHLRALDGHSAAPALATWRDTTLPVVADLRSAVQGVLREVDRSSACIPGEVVEDVTRSMADVLGDRAVEVRLEEADGTRSTGAVIARDDLSMVVENLFTNALEAMDGRSERILTVRIETDVRRVFVRVADSGSGVPEAHAQRIFEAGFSTRPGGHGGYGLTRSREIVAHYGGSLRLKPTTGGRGAEFVVALRGVALDPRTGFG